MASQYQSGKGYYRALAFSGLLIWAGLFVQIYLVWSRVEMPVLWAFLGAAFVVSALARVLDKPVPRASVSRTTVLSLLGVLLILIGSLGYVFCAGLLNIRRVAPVVTAEIAAVDLLITLAGMMLIRRENRRTVRPVEQSGART